MSSTVSISGRAGFAAYKASLPVSIRKASWLSALRSLVSTLSGGGGGDADGDDGDDGGGDRGVAPFV
jgi:hypothetical protein